MTKFLFTLSFILCANVYHSYAVPSLSLKEQEMILAEPVPTTLATPNSSTTAYKDLLNGHNLNDLSVSGERQVKHKKILVMDGQ